MSRPANNQPTRSLRQVTNHGPVITATVLVDLSNVDPDKVREKLFWAAAMSPRGANLRINVGTIRPLPYMVDDVDLGKFAAIEIAADAQLCRDWLQVLRGDPPADDVWPEARFNPRWWAE